MARQEKNSLSSVIGGTILTILGIVIVTPIVFFFLLRLSSSVIYNASSSSWASIFLVFLLPIIAVLFFIGLIAFIVGTKLLNKKRKQ